jgi:hypothetical protein
VAELGAFSPAKGGGTGPAFGLGYAYRPVSGFELGAGLRYQYLPAGGDFDPARSMWLAAASVRGFVPLTASDRVELGLSARIGLLTRSQKPGICCGAFTLAPDIRVRLTASTAIQFAPEVELGTTGDRNGPNTEDTVDEVFLQGALWLSIVQAI